MEKNSKINELTEDIFENVPYRRETEAAKKKIREKLEEKYEQLINEGKSENYAVGFLMCNYGTITEAAKLAEYDKSMIEELTNDTAVISDKNFKKQFRTARWYVYIGLTFLLYAIHIACMLFLYFAPSNIVFTAAFFIIGVLFLYLYQKKTRKISYATIKLNQNAQEYLIKQADKYKKRFLNSIYLLAAAATYVIFITLLLSAGTRTEDGKQNAYIISQLSMVGLALWLVLKNYLCRKFLLDCFEKKVKNEVNIGTLIPASLATVYCIIALTMSIVFEDKVQAYFNISYIAIALYCILCLILNLTIRQKIVYRNIVLNLKRVSIFALTIICFVSYQVFRMDSWALMPYIFKTPAIEHTADNIEYNDDDGIYTITTNKDDFKILQLSDIHLGGSALTTVKDYMALHAVYELIKAADPDIVIVTGDLVFPMIYKSFSLNNSTPIMQFATFMRNIGIPWAFTYGNHDTEIIAKNSPKEIEDLLTSMSFKTSHTLLYPYKQPDISGRNNQLIEIRNRNGSLRQALFLLDSNDYIAGINDYDYIHDDEVDWYAEQVKALNSKEKRTVPSMLFFHMPLQEYRTANELYEKQSDEVKYFFGENKEKLINKVCCSEHPSKLFDTAEELGSTKAMFCGHDHYNNLSVEYKGIRLTYDLSIDYLSMPGIAKDTAQRGGTLITLYQNTDFDIKQMKLTGGT